MKKIIHIDMDCFYAAVEMRDDPSLRDIPIAIGGAADRRGVIATCNYPARAYGVKSAMSTANALKLCPHLTLVKGRMEEYRAVSQQIRRIFLRYTDLIEPLSLDEAYLDVSESSLFSGSATLIAQDIRHSIERETGLTASAGVAPIKFVAKVASDENKPNGLCVITPDKLDDFVKQLPLKKIPGVGKVTLQKLNALDLFNCEDVRNYSLDKLIKQFGKFGPSLWDRCHGIDNRSLSVNRKRKSVGVERTLDKDLQSLQACQAMLISLIDKLVERLRDDKGHARPIKSLGVKLKFSDFQQTTVECQHTSVQEEVLVNLLATAYSRCNGRGVRLVGIHAGLADNIDNRQIPLPFNNA